MFTLESLSRGWRALPVVARAGLLVLLLAGALDVMAHVGPVETDGPHDHGIAQVAAHFGALVGMVLILLGVVVDGARRSRDRRRADRTSKGVA